MTRFVERGRNDPGFNTVDLFRPLDSRPTTMPSSSGAGLAREGAASQIQPFDTNGCSRESWKT
jgi:hypothetical protein